MWRKQVVLSLTTVECVRVPYYKLSDKKSERNEKYYVTMGCLENDHREFGVLKFPLYVIGLHASLCAVQISPTFCSRPAKSTVDDKA